MIKLFKKDKNVLEKAEQESILDNSLRNLRRRILKKEKIILLKILKI